MAGWSQRLVARENLRLAEEQRRLNERVLMAQRLEALGKLAGGVAHDFNNVLQVIQACAESLEDAAVPGSQAARDAHQITQAAERAAGLTARLLSLTRERPPQCTTFELNSAVSRTVDMLRRIIGEDITIETQLSPRAGAITADRGQFEHVLLNLGVNARDAMPGGGRIRIQTSTREINGRRHVQLVMQDTGMGMDEGTRARIFEPFFTTKLDGRGTGLGLTMAKSFLQALGGTIEVESAIGFGSTFRLLLPAATVACEDERRPTRAVPMRSASVLVVEDEAPVRTVICGYLRDGGFQVLEAANGTEALEVLARSSRPDLVLTDLVMPAMGGAELHARIDTVYAGLPVVFMTGYAPDGLGLRSQRVLRKPFARAELEQLLREELGQIRGVGEG
jgi:nitrogen-specific signal transduction histidine kinase/CheY-like chemotaxis protein